MLIASSAIVFLGVVLIILSAFGVEAGPADLFKIGCALCFAGMGTYYLPSRRVT